MGGCCCCSSGRAEPNSTSTYYYCPRASEEQVPLSAHHVGTGLSAGLLVNPDLETSIPDTYRPPPPPLPYDLNLGNPPTPSGTTETINKSDTSVEPTSAHSVGEESTIEITGSLDSLEKDFKETNSKNSGLELSVSIDHESELKKSGELIVSVVEECPTCLEEYSEENPKILTKCEHHFHLACILEWMERSNTCPVCDKEMEIENMFD